MSSPPPPPPVCWNCGAPAGSASSGSCAECHASFRSACPNCGAPAGSASSGSCAECHASFSADPPPCLTPAGLDYDAVNIPFIELTLSVLRCLNAEPAVRQYAWAHPEVCRMIVSLSQGVSDTGIRAQQNGHDRDEHLRHFTAGEIWMVDLAVDVGTMFLDNGGVQGGGDDIASDLRAAGQHGHIEGRHWKKQVQNAGGGPEEFRGLRGLVPRRQPRQ